MQIIQVECVIVGSSLFSPSYKDITTSLQHKQHEVARLKRKAASHVKKTSSDSSELDHFDVLAEPYPTLPLWRRVTKQFWWNESMLQPFTDAAVSISHDTYLYCPQNRAVAFLRPPGHARLFSKSLVSCAKRARIDRDGR